jgi:periplasmic protein CpxP/Spy
LRFILYQDGGANSAPHNTNQEVMGMARFSTSTAYLAAATLLGAIALPASMDLAATRLDGSAPEFLAQAAGPSASTSQTRSAGAKSSAVQHSSTQSNSGIGRGAPTDRVEARIRELHSQLKIRPEQEDQWNAFAQVMRENAQTMQAEVEQRIQNQRNMSAVDDLVSYEKITETHAEGLKKLVPAFQALYDSMAPEQKKNADTVFAQYSKRMARNGMAGTGRTASHTGGAKSKTQVQ